MMKFLFLLFSLQSFASSLSMIEAKQVSGFWIIKGPLSQQCELELKEVGGLIVVHSCSKYPALKNLLSWYPSPNQLTFLNKSGDTTFMFAKHSMNEFVHYEKLKPQWKMVRKVKGP